jgi:hypothetical protein
MNGLHPLALIGLLFAWTLAAQAPTQKSGDNAKKEDQCSIAGTVVKLAGGEPLRKARITLGSSNDRTRSISTTTDPSGRFELKGLDPGGYFAGAKIASLDYPPLPRPSVTKYVWEQEQIALANCHGDARGRYRNHMSASSDRIARAMTPSTVRRWFDIVAPQSLR